MTDSTFSTNGDHKVRDIGLADLGRKQIELAEQEMPGLMALRDRYEGQSPPVSYTHLTLPTIYAV